MIAAAIMKDHAKQNRRRARTYLRWTQTRRTAGRVELQAALELDTSRVELQAALPFRCGYSATRDIQFLV
jgi:hypothetical protein